jgi:hypothetical protein
MRQEIWYVQQMNIKASAVHNTATFFKNTYSTGVLLVNQLIKNLNQKCSLTICILFNNAASTPYLM